ncbi:MAG TPA: tetratricopeptide repeat protein [Vicinamibacterales bacterium]|nr:tetratricopeptide repeat protein [Vicinamibacterales bacterium]
MHLLLSVLCAAHLLVASGSARRADDPSVARAVDAARARAGNGDPIAQFSLGSYLYYGSTQTAAGVEWIRKAAAQQLAPAEHHLGQIYEFGFGVPADDGLALEWYRKAAGHGSAPAARAIGEFHLKGRGVRADAAEAARWFRRAADGDDLRAQYQLGQMYFDGTGVPRDYESAYVWFALAAGQTPLEDNRKGLLELRNISAARMTPQAVAVARRRVAEWKPVASGQ